VKTKVLYCSKIFNSIETMYFWYGDPKHEARVYGAEIGLYKLNENQINKYALNTNLNLNPIQVAIYDETPHEDEAIDNGLIPSIYTLPTYSTEIVQGPFLEDHYGIAICKDLEKLEPKLISTFNSKNFEIDNFDYFFTPNSFSIAWIKGLKWGPAVAFDEQINENSNFKMKCDSFNGTKIVSGLFDDDECIEEFNESWLDATESISGTKVFFNS